MHGFHLDAIHQIRYVLVPEYIFSNFLVSGLWGNHTNLNFLEGQIKLYAEREGFVVRTLNSEVSEKNLTYDGVDLIG